MTYGKEYAGLATLGLCAQLFEKTGFFQKSGFFQASPYIRTVM
ncbi:MAG: hypothetical protein R2941_20675 [Desulfobacterales bacterium]